MRANLADLVSRRRFLRAAGLAAGLGVAGHEGLLGAVTTTPGDYTAALRGLGIEHVVLVMLENRSFDHLLGWLPGADGRHDLVMPATSGDYYPNYPLAPDFQGCGYSDPGHEWTDWLVQHDNGRLDGFLQCPTEPPGTAGVVPAAVNTFPLGYYTNRDPGGAPKRTPDLPVLGALAEHYTVLDRYFCSFAGATHPNRFYQHAARTDRDSNSAMTSVLPTFWDQLSPAVGPGKPGAPTGAYFFIDDVFLAHWGSRYYDFVRPYTPGLTVPGLPAFPGPSFVDTVRQGLLSNVTVVEPSLVGEIEGTSGDYHPLANLAIGERFLADVYHALNDAGYLRATALVICFDEWGGFYDHVPPPRVVDDTDPATVLHNGPARPPGFPGPDHPDYRQLGFRVPCLVISDHALPRVVSAGPFEHTSSLALLRSLFGLRPLTARDANALDLGLALSPTRRRDDPSRFVPRSSQVPGPVSASAAACGVHSVRSVSPAPVPPPHGG